MREKGLAAEATVKLVEVTDIWMLSQKLVEKGGSTAVRPDDENWMINVHS